MERRTEFRRIICPCFADIAGYSLVTVRYCSYTQLEINTGPLTSVVIEQKHTSSAQMKSAHPKVLTTITRNFVRQRKKRNGRTWTKTGGWELWGIRKGIYKSNLAYALNTEMLNTYRRVARKQDVQNRMFM